MMNSLFARMIEDAEHDPKRIKYLLTHDRFDNPIDGGRSVNAAFFRDNTLDIMEELRDAEIILRLLEKRLTKESGTIYEVAALMDALHKMHRTIADAADAAYELRQLLPQSFLVDNEDIQIVRRLTQP
jgi:hypothetical protein